MSFTSRGLFWACDYCGDAFEACGLMPPSCTRYILSNGNCVDVCTNCQDDALKALGELKPTGIEITHVIHANDFNKKKLDSRKSRQRENFKKWATR